MIQQLPLPLPIRESMGADDFITTPSNSLALAAIRDSDAWPGGKMLLIGPEGSGKTHIAQIWAGLLGAKVIPAAALAWADLPRLAGSGAVVVEDARGIAGDREAETQLFHLHNMLLPEGRLLVTADAPPRDWGLVLPDLLSRLQAAAVTRLKAPEDELLMGVLTKLFRDRQISAPQPLLAYLVLRMPRAIGAARDLVAEIDARALAESRPIGLRLAAEILGEVPDGEPWDEPALDAPPPLQQKITTPPEDPDLQITLWD